MPHGRLLRREQQFRRAGADGRTDPGARGFTRRTWGLLIVAAASGAGIVLVQLLGDWLAR